MDCVIYIRWSSTEQSRGSSLERQRTLCREHAQRHGWNVVAELVDDGVSAFKGRHATVGALGGFVREIESGAHPNGIVLLVEKLDRLSREEPSRVFMWMLQITQAGVDVATVDGDRRYTKGAFDMASIIEVVVKAQLSHEESAKKASRLAAAWAAKRAKLARGESIVMTRRAPAWLTVEGHPPRFVVMEERAAVVRRIFEETAAGFGKHHIAKRLNQEGVPTFGRAAGWHSSYIQKILASATVLGEMQPGAKARGEPRVAIGDPIRDYYPVIVDADLHARAQRSMAGRSRRVAGRGRRLVNIFSGLAKCGCGERMTFRGKGRKVRANGEMVNEDYLVCDAYQRGRGCGNRQHFNYQAWEIAVLDAVLSKAMGDERFASREEVLRLEVELAELTRLRDSCARQAETALRIFLETDRAEARTAWDGLIAQTDAAKAAIVATKRAIKAARGVVSAEEHQKRIADLVDRMVDDDEEARFKARATVMDAVHALIREIRFDARRLAAEVVLIDGLAAEVSASGPGTEPQFFYRYDPGFFE